MGVRVVVGTRVCGSGNVCRCLAHARLWSGCAWAVLGVAHMPVFCQDVSKCV